MAHGERNDEGIGGAAICGSDQRAGVGGTPANTSFRERYHGLDFFRALMMTLGLVLHSAQYYTVIHFNPTKYKAAETSLSMDLTMILINTFRMPAFFALSGFFFAMMLTRRGSALTFENRKGRIIVPFLIYMPLMCGALALLDVVGANIMYGPGYGLDLQYLKAPALSLINTQHLWFVYYLIGYYLLAFAAVNLVPAQSLHAVGAYLSSLYSRWIASWTGIVVIGLAVGLIGFGLDTGRVRTDTTFLPNIRPVIFFGVFFLLGMGIYSAGDGHLRLKRWWGRLLVVATLTTFLGIALWQMGAEALGLPVWLHLLILATSNGLSSWLYTLGFWGLALRSFQIFRPWVRYFTDSSYWAFIVHLPILAAISAAIHYWQVVAELKFFVVFGGGTLVCLVTYAVFVRRSFIGEALNGERHDNRWPWRSR